MRRLMIALSVWLVGLSAMAFDQPLRRFDRLLLSEEFRSEGAAFGDLDGDGDNDIVSGNFWYEGPEFRQRHAYVTGRAFSINEYSQHFFSWVHDVNGDKRLDIVVVGFPGQAAHWFENPGTASDAIKGQWKSHLAVKEVSGESPDFEDINGDGRPELVCISGGQFGYATPQADGEWRFVAITPKGAFGGFTHGQGLGDVNKDGRLDLLETHGWWEQSAEAGQPFKTHPFRFAEAGGADMFAYDFDGDGDHDVLSSQNAHGFGLKWFEQRGNGVFLPHVIMSSKPEENAYGLAISQLHALALADIDGDGIKDIVTGKRFYAHGAGGDVGSQELPVLYWFKTQRGPNGVEFIPHLIDETSGVGTQVTVGDVSGDGLPDILVGNKRGTFLFVQRVETVSDEQFAKAQPHKPTGPQHLPGTADFANGVRSTEAQDPETERKGFLLPQGFTAELIAAEPDIQKPLNLAFDTRGRLWVSMSVEYPYAAPLDKPSRDLIKVFEDTDQDGRFDKHWVFADGLNIPIGLYPYKDGVICCSIPNLWFLRDTDGDGKCDQREVLYGPIGWERDTHGMCNAFRRGFDGWLYACHGFNNNTTLKGTDGHSISMSSGNTFRMRLDGSRVENFTFGQVNPFGQCFDPFGNLMTADCHTKPITLLLQGGYYESFGKPHDGLGFVPNVMDHLHGSTAIAGLAQVNGDSFPPGYRGHTFGGNVMTSRINQNSLIVTGSSIRAQEEPDFLISKDSWFRPVDLVFGPDGALYVADFYNRIIGHYEVPLPHPGRDRHRGRLWKISFTGDAHRRDVATSTRPSQAQGVPPKMALGLAKLSATELVAQLATDNLARRQQIADRLVDDIGADSIAPTRAGLHAKSEFVRAHALWVLFRLSALQDDELASAFKDESALVRTHACRIVAARGKFAPEIAAAFADSDPQVVRAAAITASVVQHSEYVRPLLASYATAPAGDVHLRHALKLALRQQLNDEAAFRKLVDSPLSDAEVELVASLSLALKTPVAGQFLIKQLGRINVPDKARLTELVKAAASQVSPESVGDLVQVATARFANDRALQIELLNSVRAGLNQRGATTPPVVRDWAMTLSRQLLRVGSDGEPVWRFEALPMQRTPNPFATQYRTLNGSSDQLLLLSSQGRNEHWTGRLISKRFTLPRKLSFVVAGHNGLPTQPGATGNAVRLRVGTDDKVVREATPPRSDAASVVEWDLADVVGQNGFVEIVDGLAASGYAWIAAGRFSLSELNPAAELSVVGEPEPIPLSWTYSPLPGTAYQTNPFVVQSRASGDGTPASPFFSTLPSGEQRTGILRSESFVIPDVINFFCAGHTGPSGDAEKSKNFIRLIAADSGAKVFEATPPRNDMAQPIRWNTLPHRGQRGFVEIIDGDSRTGFAWLAVGRFSIDGLNPSRRLEEQRQGAQIVGQFGLTELRPVLGELLQQRQQDRETSVIVAESLVQLGYSAQQSALVELFKLEGATDALRAKATTALLKPQPETSQPIMLDAFKVATTVEQLRLCERLAGDEAGSEQLITLAEAGAVNAALLSKPTVQPKLAVLKKQDLKKRLDDLLAALPAEDAKIEELIKAKRSELAGVSGNRDSGAAIFKKNCLACHKVGNEGNTVGPNLDGIGNRGLERLLEDVLAPNRNVDVAFRTTTLVMKDGRVLTGLAKPAEGQQLVLIDNMGKPQTLRLDDIDERVPSKLSLMPANWGEQIPADQFRDLMTYVLSLRQQ